MKQAIARLVDHYATVTNGESALFRDTLLQICTIHGVTEAEFCDAFADAVAASFVTGDLDSDGASFAVDDLHAAADFNLPAFAKSIFDALEYQESSALQVAALLEHAAAHRAA